MSNKPVQQLRNAVGGIAWVIVGEREGRTTRFHLAGRYGIRSVRRKGGAYSISGPGTPAWIDITDAPWFRFLLSEQANFSFGFNQIRSPLVIDSLTSIADLQDKLTSPGPVNETTPMSTSADIVKLGAMIVVHDPVYHSLDEAARKALNAMMKGYEYQSDFAKNTSRRGGPKVVPRKQHGLC